MKIVLIEDDATLSRVLKRTIERHYGVAAFTNPVSAVQHLSENGADVVITDIRMPEMSGFEVLDKIKSIAPDIYFIMMTGQGSISESVKAIKLGAYDYIAKPVDTDLLVHRLDLINENMTLHAKERIRAKNGSMVCASEQMRQTVAAAERVAKTDSNVLITGETGTGKELIARHIHKNSDRSRKPFADINCCNLQAGIFESELFGHKKGAYTSADSDRKGIINTAFGGTLFLDEIGEMPYELQGKFLRFLETRSFYPVGASNPEISDVRIIAATNRHLEEMVEEGSFRQDLFYRLNVFSIELPPLRERVEDIIPMSEYFIAKNKHINPKVRRVADAAVACLTSYHYPGNVRELANIIERAMILEHTDELTCESLNLGCGPEAESMSLDMAMKKHILKILDFTGGNKQDAAKLLGVDASTVYRKLKEYGMT